VKTKELPAGKRLSEKRKGEVIIRTMMGTGHQLCCTSHIVTVPVTTAAHLAPKKQGKIKEELNQQMIGTPHMKIRYSCMN
jgi:F0F1-type ATP synthase delta subunit